MSKVMFLAATAAAAIAAVPAGAVTIINGSFEQSTTAANPGSGFKTLNHGSTAITGWLVEGKSIDYIGGYWQAADGSRSIDLSGNAQGAISQELTGLTVGQSYRVSFSLAGNPDGGSVVKTAVVSDGGALTDIYTFDTTGKSRSDMGWQTKYFTFTATDTTAKLTFSSNEKNPYGPALDNVGISAVPEPATWGMMILGFGLVGGALRTRRRSAAAIA